MLTGLVKADGEHSVRWVGLLFWVLQLFETVSVYIEVSRREREKEIRYDNGEKKRCPNNHHPHLLQAR